jgi:hypothetical protein
MRPQGRRLFFGFEYREHGLGVIALNAAGLVVLRARFPLPDHEAAEVATSPAADVAETLKAFVRAHGASPVCGLEPSLPVLEALARRLDAPVRYIGCEDLLRTALPGYEPYARRELGVEAHLRAILAGPAGASPPPRSPP